MSTRRDDHQESLRKGKIVVRHDGPWGDWVMECALHDNQITTYNWESAYVAALGHAVMYHRLPKEDP